MSNLFRLLLLISILGGAHVLMAQEAAPEPEYTRLNERMQVTLLLDWTPNTNHSGFYIAQALGFYDDANLDVRIIEPTDVPVPQAVSVGVVEFGIGFQEFTSLAMAEGADVVSVAAIIQTNTSGFATVAADNPVTRAADLAPLRYAGFGFPELENPILSRLLECDGAEWDGANYLEVAGGDLLELLRRQRADFTWIFYGWSGIQSELEGTTLNAVLLGEQTDCFPTYYTPILITSSALIESNPELVAAFVQATARGYQVAIDDPEQAAALLLAAVPELDADLVNASAEWLSTRYQGDAPRWGQQELSIWENFSQFLLDIGIIAQPLNPETRFTNDFLLPLPSES
jgi:ABC-type nitrate/sulfonate/bicarbonate transport system substrate-binding protein